MPRVSCLLVETGEGWALTYAKPQSTTSDLDQLRLSKDDLRLKLQSRQHKPLTEYKGPVNIVKKTRPDGTEYVVGVTHPVPVKPVADLRDTLKARGGGKENAPCAEEESQAANAALSAAAEAYMEVMRIPAMSTTIAAPGADAYFVDAPVCGVHASHECTHDPFPRGPNTICMQRPSSHPPSGLHTPPSHYTVIHPSPIPLTPDNLTRPSSQAPALPAPAHAAAPDVPAFLAASATPSGAEDAAHHLPSQASPPHAGLGRAVRQPISRRAPPAVEREVELANLSDACEELRCRIVKYEHSTGRPDAPGLFRRPVQQGFTEFLFRASERAFEYLGESDRAREALERRVDAAEEVSSQALLLIAEMREELHAAKQVISHVRGLLAGVEWP